MISWLQKYLNSMKKFIFSFSPLLIGVALLLQLLQLTFYHNLTFNLKSSSLIAYKVKNALS